MGGEGRGNGKKNARQWAIKRNENIQLVISTLLLHKMKYDEGSEQQVLKRCVFVCLSFHFFLVVFFFFTPTFFVLTFFVLL